MKRMIGVDLLRIIMALMILLRHMITLGGAKIPGESFILSQTDIIMSCFFIISGYCLYKSNEKFESVSDIWKFYRKRVIRLMPVYWFVEISLLIISYVTNIDYIKRLEIFPVRMLGMQIYYNSSVFGGVSWFVSCILTCYIVFPIIIVGIKSNKKAVRITFHIIVILLLFYTILLNNWIEGIDTYYGPFFRLLEFAFGVLLGNISKQIVRQDKPEYIKLYVAVLVLSILCIELCLHSQLFDYIKYVFLAFVILSAGGIVVPSEQKTTKIFRFLSSVTFEIFILQDILFSKPIYDALSIFPGEKRVIYYLLILFGLIIIVRLLTLVSEKTKKRIVDKT